MRGRVEAGKRGLASKKRPWAYRRREKSSARESERQEVGRREGIKWKGGSLSPYPASHPTLPPLWCCCFVSFMVLLC